MSKYIVKPVFEKETTEMRKVYCETLQQLAREDNRICVLDADLVGSSGVKAFFKEFLAENINNLKSEFFIPLMVNKVINDGTATMLVIPTTSNWFGVTYKEDKPQLMAKIEELIEAGVYPRNLWE